MEDGLNSREFDNIEKPPALDPTALAGEIARLSDAELIELEEDLEFCRGTGVPSLKILEIVSRMTNLDKDWRRLFESKRNRAR